MPPWQPESRESIKARFNEALTPDIDFQQVCRGEQQPPGVDRKHVFDFEEGVRMIVSIDRDGNGARLLHLSFGIPPHSLVSPTDLEKLGFQYAAELVGLKEPVEKFLTGRAFHLFYTP
jgi:hypothetical protein